MRSSLTRIFSKVVFAVCSVILRVTVDCQRTSRFVIVSKLGTVTLYTREEVVCEMALKGWEVTF